MKVKKKEINKKLVLIFRKNLRLNKSFNSKKILKLKLGSDIDSLSLISIVAEIIALRTGRSSTFLSETSGPIHD